MSAYSVWISDDRDAEPPEGVDYEVFPAFIGDRYIVNGPALNSEAFDLDSALGQIAANVARRLKPLPADREDALS